MRVSMTHSATHTLGVWSRAGALVMLMMALCLATACNRGKSEPESESCKPGTEACSCEDGVLCGVNGQGVQMACMANLCAVPECTPGTPGCACDEAGACEDGLECSSSSGVERCEVTGCTVGDEGCGCELDRGCNDGSTCVQGVCEATNCIPGSDACACTSQYTCAPGLQCDVPTESCVPAGSCTTGSNGCACDADGGCQGALTCMGGVCQAVDCSPGLEGCACLDGACGLSLDGESLMCVSGVCQQMTCPAGSTGCACRLGSICDGAGEMCVDGFCRPGECIPGSLGCDCLAGGCNPGLSCKNGALCIDNVGLKGGPCKEDSTCERNNRCDRSIEPNKCVFCDLGTKGCQCLDDGSCGPGLSCERGHCVGDDVVFAREVPDNVVCFTPCQENLLQEDGSIRTCEQGLMEGCLEGQICDRGSCVAEEGGEPDVCFEDSDCPDFQLCIKGFCYAECELNSDCDEGTFCHDKVCRQTCSLLDDTCPQGTRCDTVDGQNGFCVTSSSDQLLAATVPPATGSVSLSQNLVEFTNTNTRATVVLRNDTDQFVDFTIRKVEHDVLFTDNSKDKKSDFDADSECLGIDCPLWWLETGEFGSISTDRETVIRAEPNCDDECPRLEIRMSNDAIDATRWRGVIMVESSVASQRIDVTYVSSPEGRWGGEMYYFANFDTTGIDSIPGLTGWIDRADKDDVSNVRNGLLQRWGAFRSTGLSGGGWNEMKAVLTATQTEQWKLRSVREDCEQPQGACYLYDSAIPKAYVTRLSDSPIPTGVSEFPIALNIYRPDPFNEPEVMRGRIVSDSALHYSGDPAIEMVFAGDPTNTMTCDPDVATNCVNFMTSFSAKIGVGGRYTPSSTAQAGCAPEFTSVSTPWLVPGFLGNATQDSSTGLFYRNDCIDGRLPFYQTNETDLMVVNQNIARANPLPNGKVLNRQIEFLDGAIIDQSEMIILFRERSSSVLGGDATALAYGYMVLKRESIQIEEEDLNSNQIPDAYDGSEPPTDLPDANVNMRPMCSRDVLNDVLGQGVALNATNAKQVVDALIVGGKNPSAAPLDPAGPEHVHYLCEDTGLFDGGPDNVDPWGAAPFAVNDDSCNQVNGVCDDVNGACDYGTDLTDCGVRYNDERVACPADSRVIFFTVLASAKPTLHNEPCQQSGNCRNTLNQWASGSAFFLRQIDPVWTCEGDVAFCDNNELDRREGKVFYSRPTQGKVFPPMVADTAEAFRYKTKFRSRSGGNIGFSPDICGPIADNTPYCYDPKTIESISERTDCLLDIYTRFYTTGTNGTDGASVATANRLITHLRNSFSEIVTPNPNGGLPRSDDGFEKLNSELLIMLGDDSFTAAFESRFDLAGGLAASFEGESFEPNGINLSGVAGFEMFKLYQAVQYYDMALDRFYKLGDVMSESIAANDTSKIITSSTVSTYFMRIVRASTQRARALSEIATRYQNFNRPDLAKLVAQRAYIGTYLESMMLASLVDNIYNITGGTDRPQILQALEESQLRYRVALLDVINVHSAISQDINYFGYDPDFIPFPALDQGIGVVNPDSNAFARVLRTANSKLDIARVREQTALAQTRSYETDQASFQSELARISNTYENQLIELCGVFTGYDGLTYPAITRYGFLDDRLAVLEDPCGFVDNGAVHNAIADLQLRQLEVQRVITAIENVNKRVLIEQERASAQCDEVFELADFQYEQQGRIQNLQEKQIQTEQILGAVSRQIQTVSNIAAATQCDTPISCASVPAVVGLIAGTATAGEAVIQVTQVLAAKKRAERYEIELDNARWVTEQRCDVLQIDSNATTRNLLLELRDLDISLLTAQYRMLLALGQVRKLRQQAARVQLEWDEVLQLTINVEAARNNPNIRIYRNDAVINAEVSFSDALREAYRLTRVYEYYTSTTYAQRDKLFLMRMVASGDINLENYVVELTNDFTAFEESFGNPEQRLQIISLRDDIVKVPRLGEDNEPLSTDERTRRLREYLRDPALLNEQGYVAIPFRTKLEDLSPLTRNHKVLYMEAGIEGDDNGDFLGRIYVRQQGTSVIQSVEDDTQYYRFPERTAAINTFFNNAYQFKENQDLYRSFRMRDRPMINTDWEMVINQRDELVNQDINLDLLTDIKLYIYYTDFTVY